MTRLDVVVDDKIDKRFRSVVYRTYGMRKGNLKRALEEAIISWLKAKKWSE
jgi:hypothetical protein